MKHLKKFELFETISTIPGETTIENYVSQVLPGMSTRDKEKFCDYWNQNRSEYKLHYFKFAVPILGAAVGEKEIAVNTDIKNLPEHMRLFLPLHESFHLDQNAESDEFSKGYFQSVVDNNLPLFIKSYKRYESEANDYAIQVLRQLDIFTTELDERRIRSNEGMVSHIFDMMKKDIKKTGAKTIFELIKTQII